MFDLVFLSYIRCVINAFVVIVFCFVLSVCECVSRLFVLCCVVVFVVFVVVVVDVLLVVGLIFLIHSVCVVWVFVFNWPVFGCVDSVCPYSY